MSDLRDSRASPVLAQSISDSTKSLDLTRIYAHVLFEVCGRSGCTSNSQMESHGQRLTSSHQSVPSILVASGILPANDGLQGLLEGFHVIPATFAIFVLPAIQPHGLDADVLESGLLDSGTCRSLDVYDVSDIVVVSYGIRFW